MKLSTRSRYGTRVLLDLAMNNGKDPVPLKEIAGRQKISLLYLEHIIAPLVTAGLVRSIRGKHGGIKLARPPEEIKLDEVLSLLEGSTAPVDCVNDPEVCERSQTCATRDIWIELKKAMDGVLGNKTLSDLVSMQKTKRSENMVMYDI